MAQTALIIDTLKFCLKQQGLTYARLATQLGLSETSVKRCFAEKNFTLQRLEAICSILQMEISDLAKLAEERQQKLEILNEAQEQSLVDNPKLLLLIYLLLHGLSYDEARTLYRFDEHEGIRLLARLDTLGLIQLLPGNRVRLLTASHFTWRKSGPIQRYFDEHIRDEFFRSRFNQKGELMLFGSGMVSEATMTRFHHKLGRLVQEFNEAARADAALPLEQRHGCSLVTAFRPWEFSAFAQYRLPNAAEG